MGIKILSKRGAVIHRVKSIYESQKPIRSNTHKSILCNCGILTVVPTEQRGKVRCHQCGCLTDVSRVVTELAEDK